MRRLAAVPRWLAAHARVLLALLAVLAAGAGGYLLGSEDDEQALVDPVSPAPPAVVVEVPDEEEGEQTPQLGFPDFATKNTTRVSGVDPATDAAGVALAVHPSTGSVGNPAAVTLVDAAEWQAGIAAGSLVAEPVGAPILITSGDEVPELTAAALRSLAPEGDKITDDNQVFAIGTAARPDGLETLAVEGADPAEVAAEVARLRERLAGKPEHLVLVSAGEPALAMPAAAWAARSGDPVLFVDGDGVPEATADLLRRYEGAPVYLLAPESAVSEKTLKEIEKLAPTVQRIGAEEPIENAVEFARYANGRFGWNINDPGHGLVIARSDRPLDAAAAAPLSASGTWGPLLLSDDPDALPEVLSRYLLDLKPGYQSDPTRALYNHVWLIGDEAALSVDLQARVDELVELAPVTSGSGAAAIGPEPGRPESDPEQKP